MRYLLLSLVAVGLASPGWAQTWRNGPGATADTTINQKVAKGGATFFHMPAGATASSNILDVSACSAITAEMYVEHAAASEAEVRIGTVNTKSTACVVPTAPPFTAVRPVYADFNGGGLDDDPLNGDHGGDEDADGTSEGRAFLWGFGPLRFLCVDIVTQPGAGDTAHVVVYCGE